MSDHKFCMHCGAPLQPEDVFCARCGAQTGIPKPPRYCQTCGSMLQEGDRFCQACGTAVQSPAQRITPEPPRKAPPPPPPQKTCKHCGTALLDTARRCPKCRKKVRRKPTKGQIVRRIIAAVLVVALLVGLWNRQLLPGSGLIKKQAPKTLKTGQTAQPGTPVSYADTQGTSARSTESARAAAAKTLGIDAATLKDDGVSQAKGDLFYRFDQTYNGIPVYGRRAVVAAQSNGDTIGVFGNYMAMENVNTTPRISDEEARKTLDRKLGSSDVRSAQLTIYSLNGTEPELAWHYRVFGDAFSGDCIVSAETGKILLKNSYVRYSETPDTGSGTDNAGEPRTFGIVRQEDGQYRMEDTNYRFTIFNAGGQTHYCRYLVSVSGSGQRYILDSRDSSFTHEDGRPADLDENTILRLVRADLYANDQQIHPLRQRSTVWTDTNAVTLMHGLQTTYDFYKDLFALEGYNWKMRGDCELYAIYNDDMNSDPTNAASYAATDEDGLGLLAFGSRCGLHLDTIAHEYTHSVESCISSMLYSGESGAMCEAYSDIFGELVEDYEDDQELDGDCDWVHGSRILDTPGTNKMPTIYKGIFWKSTVDRDDLNDNGHVHHNSTVISKAAYNMVRTDNILSDPLTYTQLAEHLFYVLHMLSPDSTMKDFADYFMLSVQADHDAGTITDSQRMTVHLALVRAGLATLDLSYLPEFDFIRVIADGMATYASIILGPMLYEMGLTRAELAEEYYLELTAFYMMFLDPDVQEAFREMWDYVMNSQPPN